MDIKNILSGTANLIQITLRTLFLYLTYLMIFIIFLLVIFTPPLFISKLPEALIMLGIILFFYPHFISFFVSEKKNIADADQVEEEVERDAFSLTDNVLGLASLIVYVLAVVIITCGGKCLSQTAAQAANGLSAGFVILVITILKLAKKF